MRNLVALVVCLTLALSAPTPARAGGSLESLDITGFAPSPIPGEILAAVVPIRRDARCIPVPYTLNTVADPVPNPLGAATLSAADAFTVIQRAFDRWNDIDTSFIELRLSAGLARSGAPTFDTVNEVSFTAPPGFGGTGLVAASPSFSLLGDGFLFDGLDLDLDGDPDVSNAISVCADVDGDGDIEIPEGTYPAGTILDNDIYFDTASFRFTSGDAALDTNPLSVDLEAIAVHEAGHSHGLAHVLENQLSRFDGTATTMFPTLDPTDPEDQRSRRSLASDDIATSSFFYPEGSASDGVAALQGGDVDFDRVYGLLEGSVESGLTGDPIAGASVTAIHLFTGAVTTAAYSGRVQTSFNPFTGVTTALGVADAVLDGRYTLPVPFGLYKLGLEAPDGDPVGGGDINTTVETAAALGQLDFNEEFYSGFFEAGDEVSPSFATPVFAFPGFTFGSLDFVTNVQSEIAGFGPVTGTTRPSDPPGSYLAVRIPGEELLAADTGDGLALQSADFFTQPALGSQVPIYAEALLTTGSLDGTELTVDLRKPLARARLFAGQQADFAPLYLPWPEELGRKVLRKIRKGKIEDLVLVLRLPTQPAGGLPVIGLSSPAERGESYSSLDGQNWTRDPDSDYLFRLTFSVR